jgi:hypothetical protein
VAAIVGCERAPGHLVSKLLATRAMVLVGLVSYPLYLWHWPLLAIGRAHTLGELGSAGTLALCVVAFILAWLTWRFIEDPVRSRRVRFMATRKRAFAGGAAMCLVLLLGSTAMGASARSGARLQLASPGVARSLQEMRSTQVACMQPAPYDGQLLALPDCDLPHGGDPAVLVWGDSHARHLIPMITTVMSMRPHSTLRIRTMSACPPTLGFSPEIAGVGNSEGCQAFNDEVLREVTRLHARGLRAVVLAGHWPHYLEVEAAREPAEAGLVRLLAALDGLGVKVLLVAPGPMLPHDVPACLARRSPAECSGSRRASEADRRQSLQMVTIAAARFPNVRVYDPLPPLCPHELCPAMVAGDVVYTDAHHLSMKGSLLLAPSAVPAFEWLLGE